MFVSLRVVMVTSIPTVLYIKYNHTLVLIVQCLLVSGNLLSIFAWRAAKNDEKQSN